MQFEMKIVACMLVYLCINLLSWLIDNAYNNYVRPAGRACVNAPYQNISLTTVRLTKIVIIIMLLIYTYNMLI